MRIYLCGIRLKKLYKNSKVMMQVNYEQTIERFMVTGDVAIVTIPFSALRFVEIQQSILLL